MKKTFGQQTSKVNQLANLINGKISSGIYKKGDSLPSINQLSELYNVSRDTVFKAFLDLKERGVINSTPGKGYYVTDKLTNILLLLDEYTTFKQVLYNAFIKRLSVRYKVDLLFHQYNERLFNTILRESLGKYNKYIIMNFDNEKLSSYLYKIDASKLLLLDFGKFDKKDYSYICQDFEQEFYNGLLTLSEQLKKYRKLIFLFGKDLLHPSGSKEFFLKFCKDHGIEGEIRDQTEDIEIRKGEAYIVIRQMNVVNIIKQSRLAGLECGKDFGIIAYNEMPSYEVIDKGITTLSIDWELMGNKAAEFVLSGKQVREYLPTQARLRNSI